MDLVEAHQAFSEETSSKLAYRLAIPVGVLCLYAIMAGLWLTGAHSIYFGSLRLLGVEPFRFPFLDMDAVLAAAECERQGVDVYLSNPCDALGRPHVYSPLWLAMTPGFLGRWATGWLGFSLDLLFILSWIAVLRPRNLRDLLVLGLAALSPMTVYAIERANNDLVVFLLILCGSMLFAASRPYRLFSYALWLTAGLLKYYPLVLLVLVARERWRDRIVVVIITGSMVIFFGVYFYPELGKALANIPTTSFFTDAFSAENLPFGFGEAIGGGISRTVVGVSLLSALAAVAAARTRRTILLINRQEIDWNASEMQCLAIGGVLVTACFFAGQNTNYRGILLLLVVPGLVHLHRSADETALRQFWVQMISVVLFVMWEEFFRRALHSVAAPAATNGLSSRAEVFFWIGRELVWWWLIAGLAAVVLSYLRRVPLAQESLAGLRRPRIAVGT
jgi:hypothetical protein